MVIIQGVRITLSTFFTLIRIILVPFIVGAMVHFAWGVAIILFVTAALTDIIDGNLARFRNEQTALGAYLDPLADKFLIISCLATLAYMQPTGLAVPFWLVTVVMCKEILLIFGIAAMRLFVGSVDIKPTLWGKSAMFVQVLFVGWLFACYYFRWVPSKTFWSMVIVVMIVVSASLIHYMMLGIQQLWFKNMYNEKVKI